MKYKVVLLKTTTAYGEWEIEAESAEEAEQMAAMCLEEGGEPEELDFSFGGWEVCCGETVESDEQDDVGGTGG